MKRNNAILYILFILISPALCCQEIFLNQNPGILQDQKDKQTIFHKLERLEIDFSQMPIRSIRSLAIHDGKIFLLDSKRHIIYVMDKKGKYLYNIGRPGQGPGDLEHPVDFFITSGDKIYVLNGSSKQIEIFSINGIPLKSIRLKKCDWIFIFSSLLVDQDGTFFVGSDQDDLILQFNPQGIYQKTLLKRQTPLRPGTNITFIPQLHFINRQQSILLFDNSKGTFTRLSKTGKPESVFSAFSKKQTERMNQIEEMVREKTPDFKHPHSLHFITWSNFCLDKNENLYVIPLSDIDKKRVQKLMVFNTSGVFLYWKPLPPYWNEPITNIFCDSENFFFVTQDYEFYKSYFWEKNK